MKMQSRVLTFSALYLLCGAALMSFTINTHLFPYIVFPWFVVFAVGQFWWFRCPHCRKNAIFRPSGWSSPAVGDSCRYCGKPY